MLAAEEALLAAGSPSKLTGQQVLKDLILSRTGHGAKAANNNIMPGETEGARLKELRAAMAKAKKTLCPPTPMQAEEEELRQLEAGGEAPDDVEMEEAQAGEAGGSGAATLCTECEFCMAPIQVIGTSKDTEECDAYEDDDGMTWCNHCTNRLDG